MTWVHLLILQVGFFVVLVLVLRFLFQGQLLQASTRMDKLQHQNLKKQEELKLKEETVRKECEQKLRRVEQEIETRRKNAADEIHNFRENTVKRIEEERKALTAEFLSKEKVIERRQRSESLRLGQAFAIEIVKMVLSEEMMKALHRQLVDELMESIEKTMPPKAAITADAVKLRAAFRLTDDQKKTLKTRLAKALNAKEAQVALQEETDPELLAGFAVYLNGIVLDGSLRNRLERMQESFNGQSKAYDDA